MAVIDECIGDIFDSPPHSVLIHACNTTGSWGKGVAAAFKRYSPAAYQYQNTHCRRPSPSSTPLLTHQRNLVGTCFLIPPSVSTRNPNAKPTEAEKEKQFWIACLFTSHGFGRNKDTASDILDATRSAVEDLGRQIAGYKERVERGKGKDEMGGCVGVRINSGLFGVEWERTREVLEGCGVDMVIISPGESEEGEKKKSVTRKGVAADEEVNEEKERGAKAQKRKRQPEKEVDTSGGKKQTRLSFGKVS